MGAMASVTGAYNTINSGSFKSSYYSGSSPLIYLGSSMRNVTAVSLYPPSAVNYSTDAIFATNPSYGAISDSSNPIVKSGLSFNAAAGVTTVETVAIGNFPSGEWNIFDRSSGSDGAPIGKFYLDGANPFDVNGYFKGLIPKVKITSDQSGNIQDVSVQLFKQLADGTLEQINRGYWDSLVDDSVFSYVLNGAGTSTNFTMSSGNKSDTTITYTAPSSIAANSVQRIIFSYYIGQNKFQFFFQ